MSISIICEVCGSHRPLLEDHSPWCAGMRALQTEVGELRKQYEGLKAAHEELKEAHAKLARTAQPAISASIRYGGRS